MTGPIVKRAIKRAYELLGVSDTEVYEQRREQIKSFLVGYGRTRVRELSEHEAEVFLSKFGNPPSAPRTAKKQDREGSKINLPSRIKEALDRFDKAATDWGWMSDQGSKNDDIKGSLNEYNATRVDLEKVIWEALK